MVPESVNESLTPEAFALCLIVISSTVICPGTTVNTFLKVYFDWECEEIEI